MTGVLTAVLMLMAVPAVIVMVFAFIARGASQLAPPSPGPRFAPPDDGLVLRDALLLNRDRVAIAAALVDLAVRRKVHLLRPAAEEGPKAPIAVETVEGAVFTARDIAVLEALFGPESPSNRVRRFSPDSRRLSRRVRAVLLAEVQRGVVDGVLTMRHRVWPVLLLRILVGIGVLLGLVGVLASAMEKPSADIPALILALVAVAISVTTLFVIPKPWRLFPPAAAPLREHLQGLREYMSLAEQDRLRFLQSVNGAWPGSDVSADAREAGLERFRLDERLLPYAVLFGMERSWSRALGEHAVELRDSVDVSGLVDTSMEIIAVIELVGGAVELVRAVGELGDVAGGVGEAISGIFDLLD